MTTNAFKQRTFGEPKEEHRNLPFVNYEDIDCDDPKYVWEYFGQDKYNRYAICRNTNVRRNLTMGEFYGSGVVD